MGFIKDATKFDTGKTLKQLYDNTLNSIIQTKNNKTTLLNQINAMKVNPDFTEEDWREVEEMVTTIDLRISEL